MNIIYLFYFLLKSDYSYLVNEIKKAENKNIVNTLFDMFYSTLKYGSSLEDYFLYEFYKKTNDEKKKFVTTGFGHRFFKKMNDNRCIEKFRDKEKFDNEFNQFIKRDTIIIKKVTENDFIKWCNNKEKIIIKPLDGVGGEGIYITEIKQEKEKKELYHDIKSENYIVEELIEQHPILNALNPSCVNSIRIITVNINNKPKIIAAILRIGVGAFVDNFSEGGIAAPIDLESGIVFKEGITKDKNIKYKQHPKTNVNIVGFKVPYWKEVKNVVLDASRIIPSVKTVGWDIAITEDGPDMIEGNDNWNHDVFQLPFDKGKKGELEQILKENKVE